MAATDQRKVPERERAHFGRMNSSRCRRESLPRIRSGRGGCGAVDLAMTLSVEDNSHAMGVTSTSCSSFSLHGECGVKQQSRSSGVSFFDDAVKLRLWISDEMSRLMISHQH